MIWTHEQKIADGIFVIIVAIIVVAVFSYIFLPAATVDEIKTATKISSVYDEPVFLRITWLTQEIVSVDQPVTVSAELILPRAAPGLDRELTLQFLETQLNYIDGEGGINQKDYLTFKLSNDSRIFQSDSIRLRFMNSEPIHALYCDSVLEECHEITDIIDPARRSTKIQFDESNVDTAIALIAVIFSASIVWSRLRPDSPAQK